MSEIDWNDEQWSWRILWVCIAMVFICGMFAAKGCALDENAELQQKIRVCEWLVAEVRKEPAK